MMRQSSLVVLSALLFCSPLAARDRLARSAGELESAIRASEPGDHVILANGKWPDVDIRLNINGTVDRPITLRAETPGKVVISGTSTLRVAGRHLVVKDLVFRDGRPLGEAAIVTRIADQWAEDTRFTGIVIYSFSNSDRRTEDHWVALYGRNIRFDHSHFEQKQNAGATFVIMRSRGWPLDNRIRIDHNYFGPRPILGSNTGETIRVGTSEESLSASSSVIENNIFERTDGEVEIISIKSGGNVIRSNLFLRAQGAVVLRHGNANVVEGNVFQGMGEENTGGIRVINRDQVVRNNYLEGLSGRNFTAAFSLMNGVPNSAINRYHQVVGGEISNNSLIYPSEILFGAGASAERSAAPEAVILSRNLVVTDSQNAPFRIASSTKGISFDGNVTDVAASQETGFSQKSVRLSRSRNGLLYPVDPSLSETGAPRQLQPQKRAEVGPAWYRPIRDGMAQESSRREITVRSAKSLNAALMSARDGDVFKLESGHFEFDQPLHIRRRITLTGTRAQLTFTSTDLFRIEEGGSLSLRGLDFSGRASPLKSGNAIIRTPVQSMLTNYVVNIEDCRFSDFARAADFDLVATTAGTFAARVRIADSVVSDLSGAVVAASSERGSAGLYPTEVIEMERLTLTRVGTIADVLRQGTDESTFGPRYALKDSQVTDSGVLRLSGAQVVRVNGNKFVRSAGIHVTHSVGEPSTRITQNVFDATPLPNVSELYFEGPARAEISDNRAQ